MRANQQALEVALAEGRSVTAVLNTLSEEDWDRRTDCPDWTARDLAAHLVAQAEGVINPLVALRRLRRGARRFPDRCRLDGYTAVQVADHEGEGGQQLAQAFATLWPKAVSAMRRTPGPVRRISMDAGVPDRIRITLGQLYDCILPRDLWMHRIDLSRAAGRELGHDGHENQIVGDVMRDLVTTWRGPAITLHLRGKAGGTWALGSGPAAAEVQADTVDYMRTLAGRNDVPELKFIAGHESVLPAVTTARVLF
jgi:uncharacterized protein (TIGR03083 family)